MDTPMPFFRTYLKEELNRRTEANSRYSLRAFAHFLKMDPAALSRILSGKQPLALKNAKTIIQKLEFSTETKKFFIQSVLDEKAKANLHQLEVDIGLTAKEYQVNVSLLPIKKLEPQ